MSALIVGVRNSWYQKSVAIAMWGSFLSYLQEGNMKFDVRFYVTTQLYNILFEQIWALTTEV